MAPLSLKIISDEGAVTRTVKFDSRTKVADACAVIKEKIVTANDGKEYALFLTSADDDRSGAGAGVWLEPNRTMDYYMLRDGDSLLYLSKMRNLRIRMLDGSLKTLQVDESKNVGELMITICGKIGITNHDEYGLCHEEEEENEELKDKENKPATGTLTLKRKAQQRERDTKMELLSKKLKTDDNVEWLDQHRTLREQGVDATVTVLLKRRLFFSDRNIDSRDPIQLNLLYVQTRDAILNGRHPVTEDQALDFAAIQCQIHFGDYNDEIHKPGLLENLSEYLPPAYSSRNAEKKILKLFCKYQGLSHLEAKHLYTKTARDLPTYGVTFFLVKEIQKGKKKMVPRLLGINSESILRLDENTKEILQVWPLTHVKAYHVGKNDTFTLNFGDYSDKEYSVKTNDALRIRDILEGYIDIIRKRMCGPFGGHHAESGAISQDSVHTSRGNVITHVVNTPSKLVEQSFVGPSQILAFEQGSQAPQGTQVMTVQQLIVTNKGSTKQQLLSGEVPLRGDMSLNLVKKLNRMNTSAVKINTLLNDPTEQNAEEIRSIIACMEQDLPIIRAGIKETAEKQTSEDAKNRTLSEMKELEDLLDNLSRSAKKDKMEEEEVRDYAQQIADLTTKMYFSLDPKTKRGSQMIRRSRQSFIADEKMEGTLRRASFIAAAGGASHAVDTAVHILKEKYNGPALGDQEVVRLEAAAVDKLGKLNAAVALFLISHADPSNIDYAAAVKSMNTIKELLPELANDTKTLSHAYGGAGGEAGQQILDEVKALCDAARRVCMLTGCEDRDKIQEAATDYSDVSGKLVYILGTRNPRVNADKENEIVELAKQVGDTTTLLLVAAHELTEAAAAEPAADEIDATGVRCADAARDLLTCAMLTAPTVREAHCQSALTAAAEGLTSAQRRLAVAWKPLARHPPAAASDSDVAACNADLDKAIERLKNAYAGLEDMEVEENQASPEEAQKLRFITGVSAARGTLQVAKHQLDKPLPPHTLSDDQVNKLHDDIAQTMAQSNASVASLLQAKSDTHNPDYNTADQAITTISELTPKLVEDARNLISTCKDERGRQAMLKDIRAWCQGIDDVCASSAADDAQDLDEAAKRFAQASKKLSFVFSPRARNAREQLMMELFNSAHKQAMQMVDDTNNMADAVGGANGVRLRDLSDAVHDSARALQTSLMVTGPSLEEDRCRGVVAAQSEALDAAAERLAGEAAGLRDDETGCRVLAARLQEQRALVAARAAALHRALAAIRRTLHEPATLTVDEMEESPSQKAQRLQFTTSTSAVCESAHELARTLEQPATIVKLNEQEAKQIEDKRARDLAAVNAAIALLLQAKTDRNKPDYSAAGRAVERVSALLPAIINDTKALSGACDDERARLAMLADIRAWSDAIQAVCAGAGAPQQHLTEFVESAQKFADTSSKLNFVFNPRRISPKGQQVMSSSRAACDTAQQMAAHADSAAAAGALEPLPAAQLVLRARGLTLAAHALHTTAQLTAPCLEEANSRSALIGASSHVGTEADQLVAHCASLAAPHCTQLAPPLARHKEHLDRALHTIKESCETTEGIGDPVKIKRSLQFVTNLSTAKNNVDALDDLLKRSVDKEVDPCGSSPPQPAPGVDNTNDVQESLAKHISTVNAAVATLLLANNDPQNPDLVSAEESVRTICELLPSIVKDAGALEKTCFDKGKRSAMVQELQGWADALRAVCTSVDQGALKEVEEAAHKLAAATDKMKFTVGRCRTASKELEVKQAAGEASGVAERMAADTRRVLASLAGAQASPPALALRADDLASAARSLTTAAQLTAPSIHEPASQLPLLNSANKLRSAASQLVEEAILSSDPGLKILGVQLEADQNKLDASLQDLKDICSNRKMSMATIKAQKLRFANSATAAEHKAKEAEKLLSEPVGEVKLDDKSTKEVQEKLAAAMAQVNAALASLINAKSDPQQPNYETGHKSLETITEMIPHIITDTKALSTTCKDEATREAMLRDIREWCDAIRAVCASAGHDDAKELNETALKLSNATQKLRFVITARNNPHKEQQILQLSSSACDKAKQMVKETQRAVTDIKGPEAALLENRATELSDAADRLHTTAQLSALSVGSEGCRVQLLHSSDGLSGAAATLALAARGPLGEELGRYRAVLDRALEALRDAVNTKTQHGRPAPPPPPVPVKKSSMSKRRDPAGPPAPPQSPRVRVVSHSDGRRASQDWLNHMRRDASVDLEATATPGALSKKDIAELNKQAEEERLRQEKFAKAVDIADQRVLAAEKELDKLLGTKSGVDSLDEEQAEAVEKRMEHKLARAGAAAASLVGSCHPDTIDHVTATQAAETLSEMVPDLMKDAALLSNSRDERVRRRLLDHIKSLCDATRRLVGAANTDPQKVYEAAVEFGDKSAGLLYLVSSGVDPAQEKGVIERARVIGEGASRLAERGAELAAQAPVRARALCDTGRQAADAARTLVYTAKLVAPSVDHQQCQNSLITASHELSSKLKDYSASWKPLASDAQHAKAVAEMSGEATELEKLLEAFRQDLAAGKLIKRRQVEKILVEDTPLRQLACNIMELAQQRAESSSLPDSKKQVCSQYARSLAAAVRALDVAQTRCTRSPRDLTKYEDLENAVQNLQMTLLQSRPSVGAGDKPQSNIVDLNDFVKDMSIEAEKLIKSTNNITLGQNKKVIEAMKEDCHAINLKAFRLLNHSDSQQGDENSLDGILEVEQFAQECDAKIANVKAGIEGITDNNIKENLKNLVLPLTESSNFLRFATKSALAAGQGAALDGALQHLNDLEPHLHKMLLPCNADSSNKGAEGAGLGEASVRGALVVGAALALARGQAPRLPPALLAYGAALRQCYDLNDSVQRNKVKEHMNDVLQTLKELTAATSGRVATWCPPRCARTAALTATLLQQLENLPITDKSGEKPHANILSDKDVNRLLIPTDVTIQGDPRQIEEKLQQSASKLVMLRGTLLQSARSPEALVRTAPAATDAAVQLAAAARSLPARDSVQAQRTEEASQEMCWATYSLLRAAAAAGRGRDPARLGHASRALTDAINKLTRAAGCGETLGRQCGELTRALQVAAQHGAGGSEPAPAAPPYGQCVQLALTQRETMEKLNRDEPMPRSEFAACLGYVTAAVCNSAEIAAHSAYLISISEQHKDIAKEGLVDVPRLQKLTAAVQESCYAIMSTDQIELAKEEQSKVNNVVEELHQAVKEAGARVRDAGVKRELAERGFKVQHAAKALADAAAAAGADACTDKISACAMSLADNVGALNSVLERPSLVPVPDVGRVSGETKAMADDIMTNSKKLITKTQNLLKEVRGADADADGDADGPMTWVTYNTARKHITDAYDALLKSLQRNGEKAGLVEVVTEAEEEPKAPVKSFIQIQEETARKWLQRRPSCAEVAAAGQGAAAALIDIADHMSQDLTGQEQEEMRNVITESRSLLTECSGKYDNDNASALMELLHEMRRAVEKGAVTRVVEDLLHAEEPMQDFDILLDAEKDESKRKFLLEKKIAELMSQLGRVTRAARLVARTAAPAAAPPALPQLERCCEQTELLAPLLVKAAQERVASPNDKAVVDNYLALLAQYSGAMRKVRELCDSAVDPLDFVQTAGETMARMREESRRDDPRRCAYTSAAITRLANRVIVVSMSSEVARSDPELRAALTEAQGKLNSAAAAAAATAARASRLPDWTHTTEEILKTTAEVESALGGENIFKKLPEPDQPIYNAALSLHSAVRGWSARDNEIVAVAKRMAVLMARLSEQMNADRKRELIATSKNIVIESREVAAQAKKLAQECPDVRIRTNLLQVCERIPTISGQLKMLTTVKSSALGLQGGEEDREAMNMLVTNAQNLMSSVQEVVKAAASASVKIASQRGLKWVRKNY